MIDNARESGDWVLLQNCHLAKSWMTRLERKVFDLIEESQDINDDFRLYLTSFPASYFPVSVLQNSIKNDKRTTTRTASKHPTFV